MKTWIGIDNGVSGTIGIIHENGENYFLPMPTKSEQTYTKKKGNITRVNARELETILRRHILDANKTKIVLERPMVNPTRFTASMSALRALEATLVILERLEVGYEYVDSKNWQSKLLPKGLKGSDLLKNASKDIASRMFPEHAAKIAKHGDGDGILMAEYCKRVNY